MGIELCQIHSSKTESCAQILNKYEWQILRNTSCAKPEESGGFKGGLSKGWKFNTSLKGNDDTFKIIQFYVCIAQC